MSKTKTITSMFLILLMASSVFLAIPTTAITINTSSCSHSSYEDSTFTETKGCGQRTWSMRMCRDCGKTLLCIPGSWKYNHDYGPKVFIGYDGDYPGSSHRRAEYRSTCKKCGDTLHSYGPWEELDPAE